MSDHEFVCGDPDAGGLRVPGQYRRIGGALFRQTGEEIDPRIASKRLAHGQTFRRLERTRLLAAKGEGLRARDMSSERDECRAIVHETRQGRADPVPLQHRKFRRVQRAALATAEHMRQRVDLDFSGSQQFFHREFRRSVQIAVARGAVRPNHRRFESMQMRLVAGRPLQRRRVDFDEALGVEPAADVVRDPRASQERGSANAMTFAVPEGRGEGRTQGAPGEREWIGRESTGLRREIRYKARPNR